MTNISPAPWEHSPGQKGSLFGEEVLDSTGDLVCMMSHHPGKQRRAAENAKLIAATPDLLEACRFVIDWHREHDSGEGELFGLTFVTACINAIRKTI